MIKAEFIFMKGHNVTISMKGIGNNKDETEIRPADQMMEGRDMPRG
jgi:hypothetical protein